MKIAVCGVNNSELLKKVETHYNVESVGGVMGTIYDLAKMTYDYDNVENVVFNGCVLDCVLGADDIHPFDEQIVLCALDNLDVVYVNVSGMSVEDINKYHQFDGFHTVRVVDVVDIDAFIIN
jgi:hypothetical protein